MPAYPLKSELNRFNLMATRVACWTKLPRPSAECNKVWPTYASTSGYLRRRSPTPVCVPFAFGDAAALRYRCSPLRCMTGPTTWGQGIRTAHRLTHDNDHEFRRAQGSCPLVQSGGRAPIPAELSHAGWPWSHRTPSASERRFIFRDEKHCP